MVVLNNYVVVRALYIYSSPYKPYFSPEIIKTKCEFYR